MEADTRDTLLRGKRLLDQAAAEEATRQERLRAGPTASPPSSPSSSESDDDPPRRIFPLRRHPKADIDAERAFLAFQRDHPERVDIEGVEESQSSQIRATPQDTADAEAEEEEERERADEEHQNQCTDSPTSFLSSPCF